MQILADRQLNRGVQSLTSDQDVGIGDFVYGETIPLSVAVVDAIQQTATTRIWQPIDVSTGTIKAAVGNGFALPIAGSFRLINENNATSGTLTVGVTYLIFSYVAGDNFTNVGAGANASGEFFTATGTTPTTWSNSSVLQEVTAELAYNCNFTQFAAALNALPSITTAGGVTATGTNGFFTVTWVNAGPQPSLYGDAANLAPQSLIDAGTLIDGSVDPVLREVQIFQVVQDAGTLANLTVNTDSPSVDVDSVQVGDSTHNAQFRVSLAPTPYDGQFTLSLLGIESGFIGFNDDGTGVVTALENLQLTSGTVISGAKYKIISFVTGDNFSNIGATNATGNVFVATGTTPTTWTHSSILSPVGAGNVQVSSEGNNQWLIMFVGDMAHTDMGTMTGNPSGLKVVSAKSGLLDLRTVGIGLLLGQSDNVPAIFEIQYTPLDGTPQTVFRQSVNLVMPVIKPASAIPTPRESFFTQSQIIAREALYHTYGTSTFSSAATITIAKGALFERYTIRDLNAGSGIGTYTEIIVLSLTNAVAGDIVETCAIFAASVNPTIEVHNATSGGTLLWSQVGTGSIQTVTPAFKFNGTAWSLLRIA